MFSCHITLDRDFQVMAINFVRIQHCKCFGIVVEQILDCIESILEFIRTKMLVDGVNSVLLESFLRFHVLEMGFQLNIPALLLFISVVSALLQDIEKSFVTVKQSLQSPSIQLLVYLCIFVEIFDQLCLCQRILLDPALDLG